MQRSAEPDSAGRRPHIGRLCAHLLTAVTRSINLPAAAKPSGCRSTHATVSLHGTPTAPVFHHARLTAIEQSAPLVRPHLPVALDVVPMAYVVLCSEARLVSRPCQACRLRQSSQACRRALRRERAAQPCETPTHFRSRRRRGKSRCEWQPLCLLKPIRSALTRDAVVAGRAVGTGRPGCAVLAGCTTRPRPARTAIETVRAVGTGRAVGAGRARHAGLSHESRTRVVRRAEPIGPCSNQRASESTGVAEPTYLPTTEGHCARTHALGSEHGPLTGTSIHLYR